MNEAEAASAQSPIGNLYDEGNGVAQDYQKAMEWYLKAADQGNASAQNNLQSLIRNMPQVEAK
jgi:uncharacterized protein